ncbi:TadE/TadG family type IV pilus assembly protein [Noviherbaspirillum sp. Root189]|uniref:TadE/TadG family type IV pilus assembly protein n=1 Tax=Noviherbaspirillum sp. Root189 TaxID=1736487 RepID=UPI000710CEBA|nr:TadE/TadG family type IV pilus assembly protein [Noviherbaspirillum sp. Root189]KRB87021.1 pilus assembly protein TadE [Noviherbaspirillum sp. Root189]
MNVRQSGATIIEFSLSLTIFLTFLLGITDFSRMLFTWSAANEAARMGARYAVVCDNTFNRDAVLAKMQRLLPQIASIDVVWEPAGCNASNCAGVTVNITNIDYQWISPIAGLSRMAPISMPRFSTYLPREMMGQDPNNATICS